MAANSPTSSMPPPPPPATATTNTNSSAATTTATTQPSSSSSSVVPLGSNRRSSLRLPGSALIPSPSSSPVSSIMGPPNPPSRHSRAMTPGELYNAMEQEQEYVTNNLLKHIDQLRQDKVRIEHELEAESEAVMNRLTRELSMLRSRLEQAGLSSQVEPTLPSPSATGARTPRSQSRSPSRASSLSRRSISGANSPRLNASIGGTSSPAMAPSSMSPLPRRDSDARGRASSINNGAGETPTGLERLIESLKYENGEYKKMLRELDDRYRCKQAECERQKEEITALKMEIALLQRRQSMDSPVLRPGTTSHATTGEALASEIIKDDKDDTALAPDKSVHRTDDNQNAKQK